MRECIGDLNAVLNRGCGTVRETRGENALGSDLSR